MTSHAIMLELPEELYQKLKQRSQKTKRPLEEELVTALALDLPIWPLSETGELRAYNEVMEFLTSGPSVKEMAEFQLSAEAQDRAQVLLAKEREEGLTAAEAQELDFYVELGDFLGILRAKALLRLQNQAQS